MSLTGINNTQVNFHHQQTKIHDPNKQSNRTGAEFKNARNTPVTSDLIAQRTSLIKRIDSTQKFLNKLQGVTNQKNATLRYTDKDGLWAKKATISDVFNPTKSRRQKQDAVDLVLSHLSGDLFIGSVNSPKMSIEGAKNIVQGELNKLNNQKQKLDALDAFEQQKNSERHDTLNALKRQIESDRPAASERPIETKNRSGKARTSPSVKAPKQAPIAGLLTTQEKATALINRILHEVTYPDPDSGLPVRPGQIAKDTITDFVNDLFCKTKPEDVPDTFASMIPDHVHSKAPDALINGLRELITAPELNIPAGKQLELKLVLDNYSAAKWVKQHNTPY